MKSGRPLKPKKLSDTIEVRVGALEKQAFRDSAELAGIPLSTWIRERLRRIAIRELESAGKQVPFIEDIPLGDLNG